MSYAFDEDTVAHAAIATVSDRWDIAGTPNGGYLLALAVRAMRDCGTLPDPVTVSAHYLSRTVPGPADLDVVALGARRTTATSTATLRQAGAVRFHAVCTFTDLTRSRGDDRHLTRRPPDLPPPDMCLALRGMPGAPPIFEQLDLRLAPETGWPTGERRGRAEVAGWIRFADRRPLDTLSLVFFADGFPPALFDLVPRAWVPTVELTVHVRHRPASGWLRGAFRTTALADGYLDEEGELWDDDGRLVAMSRQLARYRRPPEDQSMA